MPRKMEITDEFILLHNDDIHKLQTYTLDKELPGFFTPRLTAEKKNLDWYRIEIAKDGGKEMITVTAVRQTGFFYAIQTIKQIMRQAENHHLPCGSIEDWPDYPNRSIMFDISRDRVPTMETLFSLVDFWTEWKYNELQLYTEHTFAYSQHREVWKEASPMTADDIHTLKAYCQVRGMKLIPNQNSFGHMERWLKHDSYKHLAESPDGFIDPWGVFRPESSTLAPTVPETLSFIEGLYDELLPCFDSDYLNVGGDEPWELGKGRSKELCNREGIAQVYLHFLLNLHTLAAKKGKRIQVYADFIMNHPELLKEIPSDVVLIDWGYEAEHPFKKECREIAEAELSFYVCAGTSSWNSIGGRWQNTRKNIINAGRNALQFGASGYMISDWGDNGHLQQYPIALPGFLFGACAAWNLAETSRFDPVMALTIHVFQGDIHAAKAAMKLQEISGKSGIALHNMSLPAVFLIDSVYPYYREDYKKFRNYDFHKEFLLISDAEDLLNQTDESFDQQLKDELLFTAALLKHGCELGRLQLSTRNFTIGEISSDDRKQLSREIIPLIAEYKRLWKRRYRPGGLQESVHRLEILHASYMKQG